MSHAWSMTKAAKDALKRHAHVWIKRAVFSPGRSSVTVCRICGKSKP